MRRVLLVIAVLLGTSCNIERRPTDPVTHTVAQVLVWPDTVMVDPLSSLQFQAYGRTTVGDSVPVSVRWSASAGTITPSGLFTADSLDDDVTITASSSSGSVSGNALARKRKVMKVIVSPDASTLRPGASQQFTTQGVRNTGDTVVVSSNYSATGGTISASGIFRAGAVPGNYRVIAMRRELGDTATVSIVNAPVASVTVIPGTASLYVGRTAQLTATLKDSAGSVVTGRVIAWTSNAPSVASVSSNGVVTALAVGSATITATSEGQSGSGAVTVAVVPVASIVVTPAAATLRIGTAVQLNAATKDSAGNTLTGRVVTWSSSAPGVATVSASGTVTAVAAGSATITASSEGKIGSSGVSVTALPVASVTVSPATASISVAATQQLTAVTKDSAGNVLTGRSMTWESNTVAVATVSATGLVTAVAVGSAMITATSEGTSDTATITVTFIPVASITVSPSSASVNTGAFVQLTATPKDANGNPLTGRAVSWASGSTAIATVNSTGRVAGVAAGSATITATSEGINGTSAITVLAPPPPPPPPPPGTTCLSQAGPSITVTGAMSNWGNTSLAANTKVDATGALFNGGDNTPVRIGGGSGVCFVAGRIHGALPPSTTWSRMHDTYAMVVNGAASLKIENVRIFDYGDGPTFDDQADVTWTFRGAYLKYMRDDCIENDFLNSGLIEDTFLDGCYDGLSSRDYSSAQDGSNNTVVVRNSLIRLQAMDQAYGGAVPNHNAFWKWSPTIGPKLALYNTVFRADSPSREGNGAGMYMAPPPGKLADCENNVMVWLGSGPFPETLPATFNGKPCFRLLTGAEGLQYWNDAAAQWKANHPWVLVDAGPPIVSLFSPGIVGSTTLTGTVNITATAVDDQDVAGVQLQLNGQNIGAELRESPLTKFTLSWDSRSVPNGTYTLTAIARDTAGRTTTSGGVTVTISN